MSSAPENRCPLCWHAKGAHVDGVAHQELSAMGCASCIDCDVIRTSLTVAPSAAGLHPNE